MASVLNRNTKVFLSSVHTPDYSTDDWIHNPDMSSVQGVESRYLKITGNAVSEMSAAEKDGNHLATVQAEKMDAIDARTSELIAGGFEYPASSGNFFSLSSEMQRNLEGLNQVRTDPAVSYPVDWNHKDNTGKTALADATDVKNLYLTALGVIRAHRDSGTALKDSVRAATTVAGVAAVTDTR